MLLKSLLSKSFLIILSSFLLVSFLLSTPTQASAQTFDWTGVCVGEGPNEDVATIQGAECLIANVFIVIITLIGLVGFVIFIFGALKWMLSGSDAQGVKKASSIMLYSVVGLVVALSAFIIINLIADFTGVNVIRHFQIPTSDRGLPINISSCGSVHPGSLCMPPNVCVSPNVNHGSCGGGTVCCGPP